MAQQASPKVIGHRLPVRAQFTSRSRLATTKPLSSISPVMPLITASCPGPGWSGAPVHGAAMSEGLIGSLPLQGAFAPFIDEADRQHGKEVHHRKKAEQA